MKQKGGNLIILDSGNLLFKSPTIEEQQRPQLEIKGDLIIESFNRIGCNAFNIGEKDLALGIAQLLKMEESAHFPFISANLVEKGTGKPFFKPYVLQNIFGLQVGIFGLIARSAKIEETKDGATNIEVRDPFETAQNIVSQLMDKTHLIIALTNFGLSADKELAKGVPGIDIIIGGGDIAGLDPPHRLDNTVILQAYDEGKYLGVLDITLKGEDLSKEFFKQARYENTFVPLDVEIDDAEEIRVLIEEYKRNVSALDKAGTSLSVNVQRGKNQREGIDKPNAFVGHKECIKCHGREHKLWQKTKHAEAYESLVKKNQQFDLECIGCHTTGYSEKGGISSLDQVDEFKGVQCEACHGPGGDHLKKVKGNIVKDIRENICLKCHTKENSPGFDYEKYTKAISKKKGGGTLPQN